MKIPFLLKALFRSARKAIPVAIVPLALFLSCEKKSPESADQKPVIAYWTTSGDRSMLLRKAAEPLEFRESTTDLPFVEVDTAQRYQTIDGFGYTLTGGSAYLLHQKLDPSTRGDLLNELFSTTGSGIGISYLRLSIGASDLDDHVFSYDDLPPGETDLALDKFTIDEDRKHLIPVLKEILAINPELRIMGSPWSAPAWMKTNKSPKGGSLRQEYYGVYTNYLVKYVQEMAREGIQIHAITIQNEPENPNNNPSMLMTAPEQAEWKSVV